MHDWHLATVFIEQQRLGVFGVVIAVVIASAAGTIVIVCVGVALLTSDVFSILVSTSIANCMVARRTSILEYTVKTNYAAVNTLEGMLSAVQLRTLETYSQWINYAAKWFLSLL